MLEVLAGVPTVVYGFFAILVVAPAIRSFGQSIGLDVAPNTALAAGGVMGVMLIPFISSFADDALTAVPRSLRDGALALGATRAEAMLNVLFPAALPGDHGRRAARGEPGDRRDHDRGDGRGGSSRA